MQFKAGDLEFNATVADSSTAVSPQTGDALRSLTIQFRAQKDAMHLQALEQAEQRQTGGLFSAAEAGQPELEWRVRDSSFNYVGTQPWGINHHVWRIEQVERLACSRLLLGAAVELEPYEYVEDVSDAEAIRLAARAHVSEAALEALSGLSGPTEVVRQGISDTPRRMLVRYLWSARAEERSVVVQCEDVREPRLTRQGPAAGPEPDAWRSLLDLLHARGVVSDADLDHLRRERHAARQVASVDGWEL